MVGRVEARAKSITPSFSYAIQLEDGYNLNQVREGGVYVVSSPGGAPAVGDFFLDVSHGPVAGNATAIQCLTDISDGTEWVRVYVKTTGWNSWTQRGSGSGVATDLAIANQDADSIDIQSSTGDDVTIPSATTLLAGLMSAADKTLLDSLGAPSTSFFDNVFELKDNADATKKAVFELSGISTATTRTISIPNATGTIVLTGNTGTLQNKTLDNTNTINVKTSLFTIEDQTTAAKKIAFDVSNVTATRTITYPSDNNITLVGTSITQTLTNKTLGNTNTFVLSDSITTFQDNSDTSKQMKFELSGITTATTRTLTIPNTTATLAVAADFSQTIGFALGSASTPGLHATGDTNTGVYSPGADQLALATGGTARIWMGSSGEVAIGATAKVAFSKFGVTQTATGALSEAIAVSKTVETSGTPNNDANGFIRFFDPVLGSMFSFGGYDRSGDRVIEFATANDFDILFTSSGVTLMTMLEDGSGADFSGELRCDSFRIDATPTASAATPSTHKLAVNFNGSVYYLLVTT